MAVGAMEAFDSVFRTALVLFVQSGIIAGGALLALRLVEGRAQVRVVICRLTFIALILPVLSTIWGYADRACLLAIPLPKGGYVKGPAGPSQRDLATMSFEPEQLRGLPVRRNETFGEPANSAALEQKRAGPGDSPEELDGQGENDGGGASEAATGETAKRGVHTPESRWRLSRATPVKDKAVKMTLQNFARRLHVKLPDLLANEDIGAPLFWGGYDPGIIIPDLERTRENGPALRCMLAHQLGCLHNKSGMWDLLAGVLRGFIFFQPLLWILKRKLEGNEAHAADQVALTLPVKAKDYAEGLSDWKERLELGWKASSFGLGSGLFLTDIAKREQRISKKSEGTKGGAPGLRSLGASLHSL
ncbi:MAG: M56 family metallopeptidase [Candidatus Brocadiia bacterium]